MSDLISRQAVIGYITGEMMVGGLNKDGYNRLMSQIKESPSAQPERKRGKWIEDVDKWGDVVTTVNGYTCSECKVFNIDRDNFCPNCGADMRGETE